VRGCLGVAATRTCFARYFRLIPVVPGPRAELVLTLTPDMCAGLPWPDRGELE
jgi:hypothetical protein